MTIIRILGPVEAGAGGQVLPIGRRRQLKLFAFLVLNANKAVSSEALIEAVWGSAGLRREQSAAHGDHEAPTGVGALDTPRERCYVTVGGGYRLAVGPGELDAEVFKALIEDSHRALEGGDPQRAVGLLDEALRLWRGPPLADVGFEDFAQEEIRLLEEKRLELLQTRADAKLELGRHAEVTPELDAMLTEDPTRERVAELLMLALYRCGRQADALEVYQRVRAALNEIGLQPGRQAPGVAGGDPAADTVAASAGSGRRPVTARGA